MLSIQATETFLKKIMLFMFICKVGEIKILYKKIKALFKSISQVDLKKEQKIISQLWPIF